MRIVGGYLHWTDWENITTPSGRADSNTSAVAEHAMERNYNIDWKGARVIDSNEKNPPEMLFRGVAHKEEQVWHEQG